VAGSRDDARVADEHDLGGDPACWAHLFDEDRERGDAGDGEEAPHGRPLAVDLAVVGRNAAATGAAGAVWSLPHGGDLDANLVRIPADGAIAEHVEGVLDVLVVVREGSGSLTVDGHPVALGADVTVLVPRGARRAVAAGPEGLSYLTVHRRRPSLGPGRRG
jgi:mannose-6-phosphate isomerase-like protein (cupin superfamily)